MKKIYSHRRCLTKRLDGKWNWCAPLWFTPAGLFAECVIHSRKPDFDTEKECVEDMRKTLALFGIKVPKT